MPGGRCTPACPRVSCAGSCATARPPGPRRRIRCRHPGRRRRRAGAVARGRAVARRDTAGARLRPVRERLAVRPDVPAARLPGENLAHCWDRIPPADRERLVAGIGEALAVLHSLDPGPLKDVLGPGGWGAFLDRRRECAVKQQRAHGLPAAWSRQIPEFLDSVPLPRAPRRSLLHTEVMRRHVLVDPDGWRLTGLFDFEPAMVGDQAYDFVAVGLFVPRGEPSLLARLATAYDRTFAPDELLAYALLHVYSNLPWYLRELCVPAEGTLPALAEAWFGTGLRAPTMPPGRMPHAW
ncbi:aminoglycoside phosphotransferase family protein [Streptomyces sp. NPDC037389]|uniref:phosphotransferase family protein n=1 Tax=Streptomyces sp. NPDC037389 TaxID=3155369 RepID=UPI0033FBA21B